MSRRRIFISSVQTELAQELAELRDYLHSDPLLRQFFDVFLFEDSPAADLPAERRYLDEVRQCDIYLGLFAKEYGRENAQGVSLTELEFIGATQAGKPRLVYVKGANDHDKHPLMQALIARVGTDLVRRRYEDLATLKPAVYASLVDYLQKERLIGSPPFDAAPCLAATIDDLNADAMQAFIRLARSARNFPVPESASPRELLAHLNLLIGDRPSNAGVLLFGKNPQRFFPSSEIKCAHFHGTEVAEPIPSCQTCHGTVFQLVDHAIDFVMSKIAPRVGTGSHSARAPATSEIPRDVVAEAIVNAVAHRDYISNASVQVRLFSDRLEVLNPGGLPESLTLESLRHPHASVPRHPLLAESLYLAQYTERMGTGTSEMIRRCGDAGLPEPCFTLCDGFVTTIWRKANPGPEFVGPRSGKKAGKRVGEKSLAVVALMRQNSVISIREIAKRLGKSERNIEQQIRKLRIDKIIARVGPPRGGHWEILE
jgi:predicted HTH transcriptional regulator